MTKIVSLFETKSFDIALLSVAAAVAGFFGFNLPVATIMALLTPLMIAAGVSGWSDAAQMKAKMALHHEVKMHALNAGLITHQELIDGMPIMSPHASKAQGGFVRLDVIIATTVASFALWAGLSNTGCSTTQPIVTDVIDCAKAEGQAITSGYSIIQIVNEVIGVLTGKATPECAQASNVLECETEHLILKFGGDMVACVLDSVPQPTPPAVGSGSGSAAPVVTASGGLAAVHAREILQAKFPGKKIVHSYKKGGN